MFYACKFLLQINYVLATHVCVSISSVCLHSHQKTNTFRCKKRKKNFKNQSKGEKNATVCFFLFHQFIQYNLHSVMLNRWLWMQRVKLNVELQTRKIVEWKYHRLVNEWFDSAVCLIEFYTVLCVFFIVIQMNNKLCLFAFLLVTN